MAEIVDLNEQLLPAYLCCLEDWSEEMKDAGDYKARWYERMKANGLRVKIAVEDGQPCGMIQYLPIEHCEALGEGLYFIKCVWVHGHKQGIGNRQHRGTGVALLAAAEADARELGAKGMAAWGILLPFWMKAAWFRRRGYAPVDRSGVMQLLWKPFTPEAVPPKWIRQQRQPDLTPGKVTITALIDGWCPSMNITFERAKRAAGEFGDCVLFQEIDTQDRQTFLEWGTSNIVFLNRKPLNYGPPLSYEKIRKSIEKQVRRLR